LRDEDTSEGRRGPQRAVVARRAGHPTNQTAVANIPVRAASVRRRTRQPSARIRVTELYPVTTRVRGGEVAGELIAVRLEGRKIGADSVRLRPPCAPDTAEPRPVHRGIGDDR